MLAPGPSLPSGTTAQALLQAMRFGRDPHAFLEDCVRDHGDPFTLGLPGEPLRLVTGDPALIKQVFALSQDHYEQRTASFPLNIGERSLLFLDGEEHRRNRQVMMPPLHGERLRGYVASMREVTARAVSCFTVGSVQPLQRALPGDHPRAPLLRGRVNEGVPGGWVKVPGDRTDARPRGRQPLQASLGRLAVSLPGSPAGSPPRGAQTSKNLGHGRRTKGHRASDPAAGSRPDTRRWRPDGLPGAACPGSGKAPGYGL